MNFDNVYTALLESIQNIAEHDDRISEEDFDEVLESVEKLKTLLAKGDR